VPLHVSKQVVSASPVSVTEEAERQPKYGKSSRVYLEMTWSTVVPEIGLSHFREKQRKVVTTMTCLSIRLAISVAMAA
jgi:hypothetical protein